MRTMLFLLAITPTVWGGLFSVAQAIENSPTASKNVRGNIVFEELFFDFGTVTEGDIVTHTFVLKNEGVKKVKILKIETSCGCTTASGVLKNYAPNESGEVQVSIDTKGKKGIVVKTLKLIMDGNVKPIIEISLAMKLVPPPHPKVENIRNINTVDSCKSCHLESGVGQLGTFLYHRVCTQCHGKKGNGGSARALNDAAWQQVNDDYIRQVIHFGRIESGMPSYVEGVSPALTNEQMDSLIQYIRSLVRH